MGYLTVLYYGIQYPEECDTLWNMESLMQPAERDESNLPNLHLRASKTKPNKGVEHVVRKWYTGFPCPAEHIDRKTQIMNGFNDNLWPQIKIDHFVGQRNGFNCLGCRFDNKSTKIHRRNIQAKLSQALAERGLPDPSNPTRNAAKTIPKTIPKQCINLDHPFWTHSPSFLPPRHPVAATRPAGRMAHVARRPTVKRWAQPSSDTPGGWIYGDVPRLLGDLHLHMWPI